MANVNTDSEFILEEAVDEGFALVSSIERFLLAQLSSADLAEIQKARQATGAAKFDVDMASSFPDADSRPCYRVYEHTCGPDHDTPPDNFSVECTLVCQAFLG